MAARNSGTSRQAPVRRPLNDKECDSDGWETISSFYLSLLPGSDDTRTLEDAKRKARETSQFVKDVRLIKHSVVKTVTDEEVDFSE